MEGNDIKTPDDLSDVSVSAASSRPSTAVQSEEVNKEQVANSASDKVEKDKKAEIVQDPYYKAMDYLEEHNIIQFFQKLTAAIIFERPEDPVQFIVDKAEDVAASLNDEELKKFTRSRDHRESETDEVWMTPELASSWDSKHLCRMITIRKMTQKMSPLPRWTIIEFLVHSFVKPF